MKLPSTFLSLNARDFLKGLVLAVIVPALLTIQQSLGEPPIKWKLIGTTALVTFIGYMIKNLFTNDVPAAEKTIAEAQAKALESRLK